MADSKVVSTLAAVARWTARVWGTLAALFHLLFEVGGLLYSPPRTLADLFVYVYMAVWALALLAAWKWEAAGGAITVAMAVGMAVIALAFGIWEPGPGLDQLLLGGPGVFYLASWALRRLSPATT